MQYAFCSNSISQDIKASLKSNGVDVIPVPDSAHLPAPTRSHADMLMFRADEKLWVMEEKTYAEIGFIPPEITVVTDSFSTSSATEYPYDIRFNAALISGFLFCKQKYISPAILENVSAKIVDVKQGYAKCSMCIVDEHSFITADLSLKKAGDKCGLDVLFISPGHITLPGYNYGFIGGTSGRVADKLFFCGDIRLHPDYKAIHDFIYRRGVEEIILSHSALYDCGGILFV